ncbi:hypothetical protein BDN67DRAFT_1017046 [Paxillus ammoniavirescens]|nr:hypothetical protein BDN67DRAFT_1017046 [Paxillus ammoniavirescens]
MPRHNIENNLSTSESDSNISHNERSSGLETDDDDDLKDIRATIAPQPVTSMPQELLQALEIAQNLLMDLCVKYWNMLRWMALLEAQKSKGRQGRTAVPAGHLTEAELNRALKEDEIYVLSWKFSVTHCLWVSKMIFPLCKNPLIDLNGKEHWLSPRSVEDGLKTKRFQFVAIEDHELMGHSKCQVLLVNAYGNYNKCAPIFFPDPKNANPDKFLKTVVLVRVLKAALFGKSSISSIASAGPQTKFKIWELRNMSLDSSASAFESPADTLEDIDYKEAFEHAMEMGLPPPIFPGAPSPSSCLSSLPPSAAMAPVAAPSNSISAAMQPHLNLDIRNAPAPNSVVPPMPNSEPEPVPELVLAVPEPALEPAVKPKPKSKHKGKAVDMEHTAVGGDEQVGTGSTAGRKTQARSNK